MVNEERAAVYCMGFLAIQYLLSGHTSSLFVFYAVNLGLSFTTMYVYR